MSKFATLGLLIVFFILMSMVVVFGFFFFTPKLKTYRALNTEVEKTVAENVRVSQLLKQQEATFNRLKAKTEATHHALKQDFKPDAFKTFLKKYFKLVVIKSIVSEREEGYNIDTVLVELMMQSPTDYYAFLETLNGFEWVVEAGEAQEFRQTDDGLRGRFELKVYSYH